MIRQRGYTLIEVIVAFALLALALGMLLGLMTGATRQVHRAEQLTRATLYAQSLLTQVPIDTPYATAPQHGDWENGRFQWALAMHPYVDHQASIVEPVSADAPQLLELELQVTWGSHPDEQIQLRTLRFVQSLQSVPKP